MRLVKRFLQGRHERRHRHAGSCSDCLLQQRRQRQYLERLRGAEIPKASDDLTARLLARTRELASELPAEAAPGPAPVRRLKLTVLAAGGVAAAAALMAGSAYLMGADAPPIAAGDASASFPQQDLPVSDAVAGASGGGGTWSLAGGADLTPAGALTAAQLNGLRARGWTCPELGDLGYHLVWAKGGLLAGEDILELRLTDGAHFATVLEQHGTRQQRSAGVTQPGTAGGQPARPAAPVNVLTGHPAAADGFSPVAPQYLGLPPVAPGTPASDTEGSLWINATAPFRAIYQTPSATFTYISDLPAEQADDGVAALVRPRAGWPAGTPADPAAAGGPGGAGGEVATARLERGLGRILELLAP
jgi:hypothetical protein